MMNSQRDRHKRNSEPEPELQPEHPPKTHGFLRLRCSGLSLARRRLAFAISVNLGFRHDMGPVPYLPPKLVGLILAPFDYTGEQLTRESIIQAVEENKYFRSCNSHYIEAKWGAMRDWDVSKVDSMYRLFVNDDNFDEDLSMWDMSNVENTAHMFSGASKFTGNLRRWDMSKVTNMNCMFWDASAFNSDLSKWKVGAVEDMASMFRNAVKFNSDLSEWDVGEVTDMWSMFCNASVFISDLSEWRVGKVKNIGYMFRNAVKFNSDLSRWDVSSVTYWSYTFEGATAIDEEDQPIWRVFD